VVRRVTAVVEALLRGLSPEAQAAVIGGLAGGLVGGVFTIIGVFLGLIGEPLLRRRGKVRCDIVRDTWQILVGTPETPVESPFEVTFWDGKEIPIAVMGVRMEFYKGRKMLEEWARPDLRFTTGGIIAPPPWNLPARETVVRTITVVADAESEDKQRELAKTDRAVFVASVVGARDKRKKLVPPWRPVQRPQERPWWRFWR
jgi:hypothetical protein